MGVNHNDIWERVGFFQVVGHCHLLVVGLPDGRPACRAVLLAHIPCNRRVVGKPGNQFAQVNHALHIGVTVIEQGFVFGFLQNKMNHHPELVHVIEDHFPLIEFAAIETVAFVVVSVRPHIFAIA